MRLTNEQKAIIEDFKRYIVAKGYVKGYEKRLAAAVKECLFFMNKREKEQLSAIKSSDLKNYQNYLTHRPNESKAGTLASSTLSGYFFAIKLFFTYAQQIDIIDINPMSTFYYPRNPSLPRDVLDKDEVQSLYQACEDEQEKAILALFYGCGLRKEEGAKLNVRDVDYRNGFLYIRSGKGNKRRVIPITSKVSSDLKNYYHNLRPFQMTKNTSSKDQMAFMLNKRGKRMSGGSHYTYFKRILKRTKIKKTISLHHLRHSIATHLLAGGMKIESVRDFLGHTCLESTQIYTRVTKQQLK